ncbi:MAG: hypothetical protein ABIJ27_01440, partial [Candidatus Omnitrophota bacterium]
KANIEGINNSRIYAPIPFVAWYAGGRCIEKLNANGNYEIFIALLRERKIDYVVVDGREARKQGPHIGLLLEDRKTHIGLTKVHTIPGNPKLILYKLDPGEDLQLVKEKE